jgi:hypothetical protein
MTDQYTDRCPSCGLSRQQTDKHLHRSQDRSERQSDEIDATYAGIRALVGQALDMQPKGMKAALVGLLPEVRDIEPEDKARMHEKGLTHLVEVHEHRVAVNWAELMGPDA